MHIQALDQVSDWVRSHLEEDDVLPWSAQVLGAVADPRDREQFQVSHERTEALQRALINSEPLYTYLLSNLPSFAPLSTSHKKGKGGGKRAGEGVPQ